MMVLLLAACGEMGLSSINYEQEGPKLTVDPEGDIAFGNVDYAGDAASEELLLLSDGDESLAIVDVYLDADTPLDFSLGSELPLPLMLEPGEAFPVQIDFDPSGVGQYTGWVVIFTDGEADGREITRRLAGQGCDPEYAAGTCN